jgi:formate hydrogenlyase subunit 3/multisubunit Na+/H+ antiporter MnhD subunit
MISPEQSVAWAMLICAAGAAATLTGRRHKSGAGWVACATLASAGALALFAAGQVLVKGAGHGETFFAVPSLGFSLRLYVDGLSAVFLALVGLVSTAAALYSIDYMRHHLEHGVGFYYPNLLLFVGAIYGLVSTTDMMYFFFIFWQMMTLTGYALIRYEPRNQASLRAANRYLGMMQVACAATLLGAGLVAQGPLPLPTGETLFPYDLDAASQHLPALLQAQPGRVAVAFALFLVGFGIKLGLWPFGQFWLPDAHPAAPSPVSALLSGVMIKTGVYGLMRYFLWLVPASARSDFPLDRWGWILAALGVVTLFSGTARALGQDLSKRLLAYSSIGQAGYLAFALGTCLLLVAQADPAMTTLAATAFAAALFHTVNHGVFKSLLFLNAGAVLHATGTQDLNKLGGLMRHMRLTGWTTLVGSLAIAGVPLTSGFASKWALYGAAFQGRSAAPLLPIGAAVAILTSALTLAVFVKFFGTMFLSRRSALVIARVAHHPRLEVGWRMALPQVTLAAICLLSGVWPALPWQLMLRALATSQQGLAGLLAQALPDASVVGLSMLSPAAPLAYAPFAVLPVLLLLLGLAYTLSRAGGARRRASAPWLCGYAVEAEVHRYRARHLYGALQPYLARPAAVPAPAKIPEGAPLPEGERAWPSWSLEKS